MKHIILLFFLLASLRCTASENESIYHIHPLLDGAISGLSLAVTAGVYGFSDQIFDPRCPCPISEINGFDRGAVDNNSDAALVFTDVALGAAIVVPLVSQWSLRNGFSTAFIEDTVVLIEVLSVVGALTSVTKAITQRPLPRTYANDPQLLNVPGGYRAFFSGHTAIAAAALTTAAVTFARRGEWGPWPWITTAAVTLGVAAGRVVGGAHFNTDVIVGAAVGTGFGLLIPWLHERKSTHTAQWRFLPQPTGILLSGRW